jgi:hypothetical protein
MTDKKDKPDGTAYVVRNFEHEGKEKSDWLKIGVAWMHEDSKGFNIDLAATPVTGRIVVRANEPKEKK